MTWGCDCEAHNHKIQGSLRRVVPYLGLCVGLRHEPYCWGYRTKSARLSQSGANKLLRAVSRRHGDCERSRCCCSTQVAGSISSDRIRDPIASATGFHLLRQWRCLNSQKETRRDVALIIAGLATLRHELKSRRRTIQLYRLSLGRTYPHPFSLLNEKAA
jgi:hypothetical protein